MPVYYLEMYIFREVFAVRISLERLIFNWCSKKGKKFHISISLYLIVICVLFTRLISSRNSLYILQTFTQPQESEKKYSNYLLRFLLLQFIYNCVEKGNFSVSLQYEIVFANKLSWEKACRVICIHSYVSQVL